MRRSFEEIRQVVIHLIVDYEEEESAQERYRVQRNSCQQVTFRDRFIELFVDRFCLKPSFQGAQRMVHEAHDEPRNAS